MSVYIIGKGGYLAKRLIQADGFDEEVIVTSSLSNENCVHLDLSHPENFDYGSIKEDDFIILLAAISSPDVCNNNYSYAYNINVTGTTYFVNKCIQNNAKVLFFSSDTVYGATTTDTTVNENSICKPIGKYAEMKLEVETTFEKNANFKSFRLSYVFSKADKFSMYLQNANENEIEVFHPILRSVVYIEDVIKGIFSIYRNWDQWENSIFNMCGPDLLSRVDIVNLYKENFNTAITYRIIEPEDSFFTARPRIINMKSIYMNDLIHNNATAIIEAMNLEFKQKEN